MRIEARLFWVLTALFAVFSVAYGLWTWLDSGRIEVAGFAALVLSFGLGLIVASYFSFVARRIDLRPEDRLDAEIAEGAGELGFFSPGSYWPFGIALCAMLTGFGLAFTEWWLVGLGLVGVLMTVGGLLFEYYTRGHTAPTV